MSEEPQPSRPSVLLIAGIGLAVVALAALITVLVINGGSEPATTTDAQASPTSMVPTTPSTTVAPTTTVPPTTTTTEPPVRVLVFEAAADTTVSLESPAAPLGEEPELVADADPETRILISFDVEGLPDEFANLQATLRLTVLDSSDREATISTVAGEWDEATTWESAPALGDGIGVLPVTPEDQTIEIDATEVVTGNGRVDFYLTVASTDDIEIGSRESGLDGPMLIVTVGEEALGAPPLLVGAGDIASCDREGDEATADLIGTIIGDREDVIVYTLGDSVYDTGTLEAYQTCYGSSWGRYLDITRPAPGNRDYVVGSADGYYAYFGDRAGGEGDGYYSYHHGAWRVFVLNSTCERIGGCGENSPQYEWFVSELASTEALCVATYWQRPAYTSGLEGPDPRLLPLFNAAVDGGVDVLINSNDHIYERFAPRGSDGAASESGMRQFTVGTGGRSLDDFGNPDALSEFPYSDSFGVLVLELAATSYTWRFESTDAGLIDSGTTSCT